MVGKNGLSQMKNGSGMVLFPHVEIVVALHYQQAVLCHRTNSLTVSPVFGLLRSIGVAASGADPRGSHGGRGSGLKATRTRRGSAAAGADPHGSRAAGSGGGEGRSPHCRSKGVQDTHQAVYVTYQPVYVTGEL